MNRRILIIDDQESIHDDFRKLLGKPPENHELDEDEALLFGDPAPSVAGVSFEVDSAWQGQEGLARVQLAREEGRPYAVAFVDVRMPPGWDGVETAEHIWQVDPDVQIVLCTAYSDYSLDDMVGRLGKTHQLLILKKPFDVAEAALLAANLTEKWQLARQAQVKQGVLAAMVASRTADLEHANARLKVARDAAEAANRAKSDFLANMSHEIRTPMTAILGFAETLLEGDQPEPERATAVETIRRNGEHLLSVINDILDISKVEAGKMTAKRTACSPVQVVGNVESLMRPRAAAKDLRLHVEYRTPLPETIQTDPTRLHQILVNLLGNAIKFTESGGIRLIVQLDDGERPAMQFDVVDTGVGIPPQHAEDIFLAFSQADTSAAREFGGTGLGLTLSKRLAEMLGGDVVLVESRVGIGSRFRLTIAIGPLEGVTMLDEPAKAVEVCAEQPRQEAAPTDLLGCRVLVAEDGVDNQRIISVFLKKVGAEVTVVENGRLAAEAALAARQGGRPFDVILMDIQMPEMDGYQATALLRQEGYQGAIIALTAHAMTGDREKCLEAGCDDYLTKPIDRATLIKTIRGYLSPRARAEDVG